MFLMKWTRWIYRRVSVGVSLVINHPESAMAKWLSFQTAKGVSQNLRTSLDEANGNSLHPDREKPEILAHIPELDALGLEDDPIAEGEVPSYLQDSQALPDFIDTAPLEDQQVSGYTMPHLASQKAVD